ncbi:zinc dependent phospholipase C family protein [Salinibacillus xinjiangensis]|uniref:Phospholipase C/D domain-containing protein n=1 Tax=Salinibacillus xinjiangensis TaxID=1229268 RepID=A0A6G1X7B9_9BACI|nr:zinc dependent phospholipase C family protein [Salinibacillus xinjiangensis]MRG86901.1 hypothetical protein [Salinibacillus xinjiangensis]
MPNIWTHIMFSEEIMDTLNDSIHFQEAQRYINLGAQGPDPFFYHNFWPWKNDERVNQVGEFLHKEKCGPFLMDLIQSGESMSTQAKAYILGFVSHHILDRNTHPYIHYRAGYEGNKHQKLEVIIDTLMMKEYRNLDTWKVPVYKEIDVGANLDYDIAKVLASLIQKHCGDELQTLPPHFIQAAYRDMKRALRVLFDPFSWKNRLLGSLVSSFSHQPIKVQKDYLNLNHTTWYHPATNEPHDESFLDLYNQARKEGMETLYAIIQYWQVPSISNKELVETMIGNISYDTGKPLRQKLENRYCEPIV